MRDPVHYWIMKEMKVMWSKTWLPQWNFSLHIKSVFAGFHYLEGLWFSGLQLYGVALRDTVHLYHVTSYFLLYPLLYGVALSDSVNVQCSMSERGKLLTKGLQLNLKRHWFSFEVKSQQWSLFQPCMILHSAKQDIYSVIDINSRILETVP